MFPPSVFDWRTVPERVAALYTKCAAGALEVRARYAALPGAVAWDPGTGRVAYGTHPGPPYLLVKRARQDFLRPAADAFATLQRPLGGPHPLAATIVGGLLGSGLGYGGGWLAEHLLPGAAFERGRLRRAAALAGGVAGALPGLGWAGVNLANRQALTSPWPFKGAAALPACFVKAALDSGILHTPTIPVDAFNQVLWSDALQPANSFGTKSPWGDNSQPLQTPPWVAAAASGILAGTAAATGRDRVSPAQVALAAAATAGTGYLGGLAFGKTLGALAGLRPEAQRQLQDLGLWGGLVTGAVTALLGDRAG